MAAFPYLVYGANMKEEVRDITHQNVIRLLDAIKSERKERVVLQGRVDALQKHVNQMTKDLAEAKSKAGAAFAIAHGGGSTTG